MTHNSCISANIRYVLSPNNFSNCFAFNELVKKTRQTINSANTTTNELFQHQL